MFDLHVLVCNGFIPIALEEGVSDPLYNSVLGFWFEEDVILVQFS